MREVATGKWLLVCLPVVLLATWFYFEGLFLDRSVMHGDSIIHGYPVLHYHAQALAGEVSIPGLTYDDYDKRSITVVIKDKDHLNGTLRLISGDGCLLPTETLFDNQKGLEHIRDQQNIKGKTISEISKLALSKDANPTIHYRTLVASKNILAKPLNIGNEISIVPKSEYEKRYNRIGFVAELTKRFYHELEEPDVICSWDQDTQLTPYYKNIVLKETGNKVTRRKNTSSSINDLGSISNLKRSGRH